MAKELEYSNIDRGLESASDPAPFPYMFVVGCPRSGTTLLQRILDHHPSLAVGYDTHFIPHAVRRFPLDVDPLLTPELATKVISHRRFSRLGLPQEAVERSESISTTYSEFIGHLYREFATIHNKEMAGEKSPGYCRHIPRLHALFPRSKFVHLIRDGRDVTLSVLDWGKGQPARLALWEESPVGTCALWWKWKVEKGRKDGKNLGSELYQEIRYENLVREPERCTRSVIDFLQLPYSSEMLAYHEGKMRKGPGLSAKAAWIPPTPGLRDWRQQMASSDVELFESLAGETLATLGYERVFPRISASVLEESRGYQEWWRKEME